MKKQSECTARFYISSDEHIKISNVERFRDGSGYRASLEVMAREFACRGKSFYFYDLPKFLSELRSGYDRLEGIAELRPQYGEEFLRFQFRSRGELLVSGLLVTDFPFFTMQLLSLFPLLHLSQAQSHRVRESFQPSYLLRIH